ncbi:MAG: TonB-dependent receptor [Kiritimatiellia bacterium]
MRTCFYIVASALVPFCASAKETSTAPLDLGPITVTASKFDENPQELPLSLSVFTQDSLSQNHLHSMQDISALTPGFSFYSSGSRRTALYYLRGIGSSGPTPPAVGVFLDDVYLHKTGFSDLELYDVEQIEILRGPQSTLYGKNTQAGAVKIQTVAPGEELNGHIEQTVGNGDYFQTRTSAGTATDNGKLSFRSSMYYRERDGYVENDFLDTRADNITQKGGMLSLRAMPMDMLDMRLTLLGDRDSDGGYAMATLDEVERNPHHVSMNIPGAHERDLNLIALDIKATGEDFTLRSITSFTDWMNHDVYDSDFSAADIMAMNDKDWLEAFTQELRFSSGDRRDELRWMIGGFYSGSRGEDENISSFGNDGALYGAAPGFAEHAMQDTEAYTLSAFGHVIQPIGEKASMRAGLRYDFDRFKQNTETSYRMGGFPVSGMETVSDDARTEKEWSPEIALDYLWASNLLSYARIAKGWRAGGFNSAIPGADPDYDPETSWNYEAGIKAGGPEDRVLLNLSVFHIRIEDQQLMQFAPNSVSHYFRNAGKAESRGLEAEFNARITHWLDVLASAGYADMEYTDAPEFDGNKLPFAPAFNYAVAARCRLHIRGPWEFVSQAGVHGQSSTYWDEANDIKTDGYSLVDLQAGVENESWSVRLFAKNLLDEEYAGVVHAFPGSTALAQAGDPLTCGITVSCSF